MDICGLRTPLYINRTVSSVPNATFVYLTTPEMRTPHYSGHFNSEVVKYTNVSFGTDESVLFIEVSSIQRCFYREVPFYLYPYSALHVPHFV